MSQVLTALRCMAVPPASLREAAAIHITVRNHCAQLEVGCAGGAWIIGYKAWGALLAKRLSLAGAVVCCLDYRNFPQVRYGQTPQSAGCR
jgi:acetyl esterase/lipase